VQYDSVLSQQSISGGIVSLILCVWKLGFFKSSHICKAWTFTSFKLLGKLSLLATALFKTIHIVVENSSLD